MVNYFCMFLIPINFDDLLIHSTNLLNLQDFLDQISIRTTEVIQGSS